ncbi:MAG: peptide deformylase [Pseudomonadaceae bacterium]|nr:peptide deformylase [Pseudomonadaceae bacterium]
MSDILPIVLHPHRALRQVAETVTDVDAAVASTLHTMLETMAQANGIGLAAPQVDINKRLVVIQPEVEGEPGNRKAKSATPPLLMANPEIVAKSDEMIDSEEGCLSIPRVFDVIPRHAWVKVAYVDEHGNPREVEGEELLGRCLQHEIDHLNGVLFIDHLSRLKRDLLAKRYNKILPDFVEDTPYPFTQES